MDQHRAPIAAPGIYAVSDKDYLADPVVEPSLNNSIAKLFAELSPAHARAAHPRFNAELEDDSTEAQDVGSAAHAAFLRGDSIIELVDFDNYRTKAARMARDSIIAAGRVPLKRERYDAVHRIVAALEEFRARTGAFTQGKPEQTLVWREGLAWCRAKVDWLPDEPSAPLWDLKIISGKATLRGWTRQAFDLGTDMQAAFYPRGAESVRGEPPEGMNFCVVESTPPHGIAVFGFSPVALEIAHAKVAYAIRRWQTCIAENRWPSYDPAVQWIDPPVWIMREWDAIAATNDLRSIPNGRADHATVERMIESGNLAG